jgi:redox-sensitive bicupin YhaK (pirin superfamily)
VSTRTVAFVADPILAPEAKGVNIYRSIGSERLIYLDPFLLLDHLKVDAEALTEPMGFPRHPHRGIETLTYVFRGKMAHKDSLGNEGVVHEGGSQWMTAGRGIWHEEMLHPDPHGNDSLQIWFNLAADDKFKPAGYQGRDAHEIPQAITLCGSVVNVVAGEFEGVSGAFEGIGVAPHYFAVELKAGDSVTLPAPAGWTAFIYTWSGNPTVGGRSLLPSRLALLSDGEGVRVGCDEDSRFIFAAAKPLNEPVMQYRSLVLNTVEQMGQALQDIENGTFA